VNEVKSLIHSYGGGVQSVALAVLIAQREVPQPDHILIADTGREASSTWRYLHGHVAPMLARVGQHVEILPHSLSTVDLYSHKGKLLLPAFSLTTGAPAPTYCSVEWKRRVVRRWLRQQGYGRRRPVAIWLGISLDELGRAKSSDVQWVEHVYPLLTLRLTRQDCLAIIAAAGLPEPSKSACWMCPWRTPAEWADLTPDERAAAAELDRQLRDRDGVSLFDARGSAGGCDSGGYCWT
jgi:hypothetical protein